jgi:hypothetical protein
MGKEVFLEPKGKAKARKPQNTRRERLKVEDLAIEVGQGARHERKEQAKFLEEFINTKREMGEEDAVTVDARSRKSVWKWSEFFKAKNQREMLRLRKIIYKGGEGAAEATTKLKALEEEEKMRAASVAELETKKSKPRKGSDQKSKGVPGGSPKPKRGRPALGKLRKATDTPTPAAVGTPGSGMGSAAPPSPGGFGSDEMEVDDQDNEDEDTEEGEGDSEEEDSDEGDSEAGDNQDEDSDEEQSPDGEVFSDSSEHGSTDEDDDEDEDDDDEDNMYG